MVTLPQLVEILKNNWEGNQVLQMKMINEGAKFGNGQKEAGKRDRIVNRLRLFMKPVTVVPVFYFLKELLVRKFLPAFRFRNP